MNPRSSCHVLCKKKALEMFHFPHKHLNENLYVKKKFKIEKIGEALK